MLSIERMDSQSFTPASARSSSSRAANERNQRTYESADIVFWYARTAALSPPEQAIVEQLRPRLASAELLDIGVGGGRTTGHLLPLVRRYVGIDYSAAMIAACERRYPDHAAAFSVCDARDLSRFDRDSFDVVLFSFNGIDYIPHEDRARVLSECRRVCRPGGLFCYSSHNLLAVRKTLASLSWRSFKLKLLNSAWRELRAKEHAHVRESPRIAVYYATPAQHLRELEVAGFLAPRVYRLSDGTEFSDRTDLLSAEDPWLYYLCEV